MKLDEYLRALQDCPDEQLKDELGIYDNWPIFLNADFGFVVEYLIQSESYRYDKSESYRYDKALEKTNIINHFDYVPGNVNLQVFNWIPPNSTTGCGCSKKGRDKIESERQLRDYNMTILLHPYQDRKIEGIHRSRALAMVACDMGQFAIRENIPLCMPKTIGWKYLKDVDYSKIVYHQPK